VGVWYPREDDGEGLLLVDEYGNEVELNDDEQDEREMRLII
jgi:hypothetical protein